MVVVAEGTEDSAKKLSRVLENDPLMGVLRHADAGYDEALSYAAEAGIRIPAREK
jgi:urocanate hydratase